MGDVWQVTLDVEVDNEQALWRKAHAYMLDASGGSDEGVAEIIGTEEEPDVGGCLQMLLDRSEHLDGAEIEQSSSDLIRASLDNDDGSDDFNPFIDSFELVDGDRTDA